MKYLDSKYVRKRILSLRVLLISALVFLQVSAKAQQLPPRPVNVYAITAQSLTFGAFFPGASGGSVIMSANGTRSSTGSVILANLGFNYSQALFEVDAEPGTLMTIMNGPDVTLSGSNGGSMTLHIGASSTGSPFVTTAIPPARTSVLIGGTLTVPPAVACPAGNYTGSFSITFIQQ